jgi:FMN phosphatase YigB (HAD superfamily)
MIKAVLLDLDDTLLSLDTEAFSRKYLGAMAAYIMQRHPALSIERYQQTVRTAIQSVVKNRDPNRTNAEVMNSAFSVGLDIPLELLEQQVDAFYVDVFPTLRGGAAAMEGSSALIAALVKRGYEVVVATNPVFPPWPVHSRLRWAGLDPEAGQFRLITTMDIMHFCKPTPHYYEEILAQIGVEAEDAIMVGDSLENDIIPARAAGLATFWIRPQGAPQPPEVTLDGAGSLLDFLRCVQEGWLNAITPQPRTAAQVAPRMIGNVAALYGLTRQLGDEGWLTRPRADEWNPLELVTHLHQSESATQRAQLLRIAIEDNPFLPPTPPPPNPGQLELNGRTGPSELNAFWAERQATLAWLAGLPGEAWDRPARHSIFGPTSLLEMAHFTARHDRLHINQLCEMIGHCNV